MQKKELKVLGLSTSYSQSGAYVVVLSDTDSDLKLPIIIKSNEAQKIAFEIEGIKLPRPSIYDLFRDMSNVYGVDVQEVFIYSMLEGIFYTKIIASNAIEEVEFECSVGEAIVLSLIYNCPLVTTPEILKIAGILIDDDGNHIESEGVESHRPVSVENLEKMIKDAIESEEYEVAAELRDRIDRIKNKK
jgi:uncharacterized protein